MPTPSGAEYGGHACGPLAEPEGLHDSGSIDPAAGLAVMFREDPVPCPSREREHGSLQQDAATEPVTAREDAQPRATGPEGDGMITPTADQAFERGRSGDGGRHGLFALGDGAVAGSRRGHDLEAR